MALGKLGTKLANMPRPPHSLTFYNGIGNAIHLCKKEIRKLELLIKKLEGMLGR